MARKESSTLRINVEIKGDKIKVLNAELGNLQTKTGQVSGGMDRMSGSVEKAGTSAAASAVHFQTMTQGMLNLVTTGAQVYTSMSNLDRAANRLAQAQVGLARAEDLLANKEIRLSDLRKRGLADTDKAIQLEKELATAKADIAVKTDKLRIEEGALNDVRILFATNIANVMISSMQTIKTMKDLNIASTIKLVFHSKVLNSTFVQQAILGRASAKGLGELSFAANIAGHGVMGLNARLKMLMVTLGPIAAAFVGLSIAYQAFEEDWGGFGTELKKIFPFLRDLNALQKDVAGTVENWGEKYDDVGIAMENLEKKGTKSLTAINKLQIQYLNTLAGQMPNMTNYLAIQRQIAFLHGQGITPSGFSTPSTSTVGGTATTTASAATQASVRADSTKGIFDYFIGGHWLPNVKQAGAIGTTNIRPEPSLADIELKSRFTQSPTGVHDRSYLEKVFALREMYNETDTLVERLALTGQPQAMRNALASNQETMNIGMKQAEERVKTDIANAKSRMSNNMAKRQALLSLPHIMPHVPRNYFDRQAWIASGSTGIPEIDNLTKEIIKEDRIIRTFETRVFTDSGDQKTTDYTGSGTNWGMKVPNPTEERQKLLNRQQAGYTSGQGITAYGGGALENMVMLPGGNVVDASGLTNKERQKLANVYQQYNLSMGTFDFGTNTGNAMAIREMLFPSSTSLYGFSMVGRTKEGEQVAIQDTLNAIRHGLKTPKQQISEAEARHFARTYAGQGFDTLNFSYLTGDERDFGQEALSQFAPRDRFTGSLSENTEVIINAQGQQEVVNRPSGSARRAMAAAQAMGRITWGKEQARDKTAQSSGENVRYWVERAVGAQNLTTEDNAAIQSLQASHNQQARELGERAFETGRAINGLSLRLSTQAAAKALGASIALRIQAEKAMALQFGNQLGISQNEALQILRDKSQGEQTLNDMLLFQQRLDAMSNGVVS